MAESSPVPRQCIDLLLASITHKIGEDGLRSSFFFGKPGSAHWERRMGTDIYYHDRELTVACLHLRKNGPTYLRSLAIGQIWSMLQNFISENYWYLFDETWARPQDGNFASIVSERTKEVLANVLESSQIFRPRNDLTLFPLATVQVLADFDSDEFFLVGVESLTGPRMPDSIPPRHFLSKQFPPLIDWRGTRETPTAWLGVRSPVVAASEKMKAAILGALALAPLPRHRHMFSGRRVFGGSCTIAGDTTSTQWGAPHTPPIMYDIRITHDDHTWLGELSLKLRENRKVVRRQLRALEYFYRAWSLDPSERFPVLCMTLDSIFGDVSHATQAVIEGVRSVLGQHVPSPRLRLLMDLRASVIHGGAPDVYDSGKYARYYEEYGTDPIQDMELVVARSLTKVIFNGSLIEQVDPNANTIQEARLKGRLPRRTGRPTVLDESEAAD